MMAYLPFVMAVIFAWIVAVTRKDHRPLALLLSLGLAIDLTRHAIGHPTTPASFIASEALYLLWSAAVVDALLHQSFGVFRGAMVVPWLSVVGVVAYMAPVSGHDLESLHRFLHVLGGLVCVASLLASNWRKVTSAVVGLLLLGSTEILLVLGPYVTSHAARSWEVACWIYGTAFSILTFLFVGVLCSPLLKRWTRFSSPTPT